MRARARMRGRGWGFPAKYDAFLPLWPRHRSTADSRCGRNAAFLLVSLFQCSTLLGEGIRRLGKLEGNNWETHANLANNAHPFQTSNSVPDFSVVGG